MGRPRTRIVKAGQTINVAFRLDGEVVKKLDSLADHLSRARPGLLVTRSDVVKMAIFEFLKGKQKRPSK